MTQMVWVVKSSPCKLKDGGSIFAVVFLRGQNCLTRLWSNTLLWLLLAGWGIKNFRTVARLGRLCWNFRPSGNTKDRLSISFPTLNLNNLVSSMFDMNETKKMYTDIQFTHRVRDVVAIVYGRKSCRAEWCVYKTQEKLPGPLVSKQLVIVAAYLK